MWRGRWKFGQHRWTGRRILQKSQGRVHDGELALRVIRFVERVTMPEWDKERARRTHTLDHLAQKLNHHCGNAMTFQFGADQTHGLVAHGSNRHEQRDVRRIFDEQLRGGRRGLLDQSAGRRDRTHERKMPPTE